MFEIHARNEAFFFFFSYQSYVQCRRSATRGRTRAHMDCAQTVKSLPSPHHHQSLNREGRWGTTDDFATSFLHFSLFSTALWDLPNSRPVHSLMSSHLFLCLPCLLPPFTVPCKMVLARPDEPETCPYHSSMCLFTMARRSSCGPIAYWILARTKPR